MATSALNVLSGIGAAVAGLSGETVSKTGSIPGFDLAAILPALLGKSGGGTAGNLLGTIASVASKTGVLNSSNLAGVASSLLSFGATKAATTKKADASGGVAGLAAAIMGCSGKGASLVTIATMASTLSQSAKGTKGVTSIATQLGKTLNSSFGVAFEGSGTAIKALDKVMDGTDLKSTLFKSVLKGLV